MKTQQAISDDNYKMMEPHWFFFQPKRDTPIAKVEYEIASKPSETKIKIVTKENRSPVAPAAPVTRTVTPKPVSPVRSPVVTVADKLNDKERFIAVKKEKVKSPSWLKVIAPVEWFFKLPMGFPGLHDQAWA